MKLEYLRYIVQISTLGSINKASQMLYVSQSTLSRAVQAVEDETGIVIFNRFQSGVTLTPEGEMLVSRANKILMEVDGLKSAHQHDEDQTLIVGEQRMTLAVIAFDRIYVKHCRSYDQMDIIIKEGSRQDVISDLADGNVQVGLLYFTSNEAKMFEQDCARLGISYTMLDQQPLCVQVGSRHPLAKYDKVSVQMLSDYPRVAFLDEDVSGINYCADVSKLNTNIVRKRILVQERGTLREILNGTEAYYIGTRFSSAIPRGGTTFNIRCIPIEDYGMRISTVFAHRNGHALSPLEQHYLEEIKAVIAEGQE